MTPIEHPDVPPDDGEVEHGDAPLKRRNDSGTYRITPPHNVRDAVGMEPDEAWSWFFDPAEGWIYMRRASAGLVDIPDRVNAVGTTRGRDHVIAAGRSWIDFHVPADLVDAADAKPQDTWLFYAIDDDTIQVVPE